MLEDSNSQALIDTGASENFIHADVAKRLRLKPDGDSSEVALASTTSSVKIHGFVNVNASVLGNDYLLKLGVIDKLYADIILGQDFLKLHESVTIEMGSSQPSISICNKQERKATCSVSMAKIFPPRLFQFLDCKSCIPIATKSRKFKEDKKFIREEISKLLTEGIIEPSEWPWRAQVLVTKNERHKKRMVIDYSQTINRYTFKDAYPLPRIGEQINALAQCKVFSTLDLKSAHYQIPIAEEDRPYTAFEADGRLYHYCRLPFGLTNEVSAFQRIIDSLTQRNKLKKTYAYLDNITVAGETQEIHDSNVKAFLQTASEANLTFNESKSTFSVPVIDVFGYRISHQQIKPDPERLRPLVELPIPKTTAELKRCVGMFAYYARWNRNYFSKIKPLIPEKTILPLNDKAVKAFNTLRQDLLNACLGCINDKEPFTVECDASNFAIAAVLNKGGRPVAFMSRTLNSSECNYSTVEKEATSIIDAIRK